MDAKPSRRDRAVAAYHDSCQRRELPDHPASRVLEMLMGRPSITEPEGGRRYRTLDDEFEHLRLWTVLEAAWHHPLLEACTRFSIEKAFYEGLPPVVRLHARILVPPRRPGWEARNSMQFDPRDIWRAPSVDGWREYARQAVREWLRVTEQQLAEALDNGE